MTLRQIMRVPAGVTSGGQFATSHRGEAAVTLDQPRVTAEYDGYIANPTPQWDSFNFNNEDISFKGSAHPRDPATTPDIALALALRQQWVAAPITLNSDRGGHNAWPGPVKAAATVQVSESLAVTIRQHEDAYTAACHHPEEAVISHKWEHAGHAKEGLNNAAFMLSRHARGGFAEVIIGQNLCHVDEHGWASLTDNGQVVEIELRTDELDSVLTEEEWDEADGYWSITYDRATEQVTKVGTRYDQKGTARDTEVQHAAMAVMADRNGQEVTMAELSERVKHTISEYDRHAGALKEL
ncbi:hypothetical protein V5R04_06985 [Jonesiaceae bacterium BS-20]|uniref:Uncharacterized protein n=1 Tax=Jonesiaceae bacterium BS-20 TaxID=3120821 RepID=A0AAU7E0A2_9MICO